MRYKICPNCGTKNPEEEFLCINCMTDLSNANITEEEAKQKDKPPQDDEFKTIVETKEKLVLEHEKFKIEVYSGDIVGRHHVGSQYLKDYPTVSRTHAKFYKEQDGWYIEDLGSSNGTYVNEKKISEKTRIKKGDVIGLSSGVLFKVI